MKFWPTDLTHLTRDEIAAELARAEALGQQVENRAELIANARDYLDFADDYDARLATGRARREP